MSWRLWSVGAISSSAQVFTVWTGGIVLFAAYPPCAAISGVVHEAKSAW